MLTKEQLDRWGCKYCGLKLGKPNYVEHCNKTVSSVVEKLGLNDSQWSISYQSRLGPVRWLKPSTDSTVKSLALAVRE